MSEKENGGQAFPMWPNDPQWKQEYGVAEGMTLRDYFAAKAMSALIQVLVGGSDATAKDGGKITEDVIAAQAYYFADAMIKARSKQ